MKNLFNTFFNRRFAESETANPKTRVEFAAACLLIETSVADNHFSEEEQARLNEVLINEYNLEQTEIDEFTRLAREEVREATSLYQFTRLINDEFSQQEKAALIKQLWAIAYADSVIDKYEEHTIRKIADLLHVSHQDFILGKQAARNEHQA